MQDPCIQMLVEMLWISWRSIRSIYRIRLIFSESLARFAGQDRRSFLLARVDRLRYRLGQEPVTCQHTGGSMYSQAIANTED